MSRLVSKPNSKLTRDVVICNSVKTQMAARHANEETGEHINGEAPQTSSRSIDDEEPEVLSEKQLEKKQAPRQG